MKTDEMLPSSRPLQPCSCAGWLAGFAGKALSLLPGAQSSSSSHCLSAWGCWTWGQDCEAGVTSAACSSRPSVPLSAKPSVDQPVQISRSLDSSSLPCQMDLLSGCFPSHSHTEMRSSSVDGYWLIDWGFVASAPKAGGKVPSHLFGEKRWLNCYSF